MQMFSLQKYLDACNKLKKTLGFPGRSGFLGLSRVAASKFLLLYFGASMEKILPLKSRVGNKEIEIR